MVEGKLSLRKKVGKIFLILTVLLGGGLVEAPLFCEEGKGLEEGEGDFSNGRYTLWWLREAPNRAMDWGRLLCLRFGNTGLLPEFEIRSPETQETFASMRLEEIDFPKKEIPKDPRQWSPEVADILKKNLSQLKASSFNLSLEMRIFLGQGRGSMVDSSLFSLLGKDYKGIVYLEIGKDWEKFRLYGSPQERIETLLDSQLAEGKNREVFLSPIRYRLTLDTPPWGERTCECGLVGGESCTYVQERIVGLLKKVRKYQLEKPKKEQGEEDEELDFEFADSILPFLGEPVLVLEPEKKQDFQKEIEEWNELYKKQHEKSEKRKNLSGLLFSFKKLSFYQKLPLVMGAGFIAFWGGDKIWGNFIQQKGEDFFKKKFPLKFQKKTHFWNPSHSAWRLRRGVNLVVGMLVSGVVWSMGRKKT